MPTRIVLTDEDRAAALTLIRHHPLPYTLSLAKGVRRTAEQNRLQRLWLNEAAEFLDGHTAEELRAHCKLEIGVPILREENEEFREMYDKIVGPMPYEQKLIVMQVPIDFPVTRMMTRDQKTRYLDSMYEHFRSLGVPLTSPQRRKRRR